MSDQNLADSLRAASLQRAAHRARRPPGHRDAQDARREQPRGADGRRRARPDPFRRARAASRRHGARGGRRAARDRRAEQPARRDDRARLPRHDHPARRTTQRARGPVLVHRLHAVPARDQPGPARGAAQLPDDGRRPHRAVDLQRLAARRGHRGRRGDDARAPREEEGRGRSSSTPTRCRRRSRWCAPAPRPWASRWSSPTWPTVCPRETSPECSCSTPAPRAGSSTRDRSSRRSTSAAGWRSWPPTCWR